MFFRSHSEQSLLTSLLIFNMSGTALPRASLTHREEVRLLLQCSILPQTVSVTPGNALTHKNIPELNLVMVRGRGEEASVSLLLSHSQSHFNITSMGNGKGLGPRRPKGI